MVPKLSSSYFSSTMFISHHISLITIGSHEIFPIPRDNVAPDMVWKLVQIWYGMELAQIWPLAVFTLEDEQVIWTDKLSAFVHLMWIYVVVLSTCLSWWANRLRKITFPDGQISDDLFVEKFVRPVCTSDDLFVWKQPFSNLNQQHPTSCNMVAERTQHVAPKNVAICSVGMLWSFGWGFKWSVYLHE